MKSRTRFLILLKTVLDFCFILEFTVIYMADPKVILWTPKRFFYKGDCIKVGIEFGLIALVNFVKKNNYLFYKFIIELVAL